MSLRSSGPELPLPPLSEGKACPREFFPSPWEVIQEAKGNTVCLSAERTETAPEAREQRRTSVHMIVSAREGQTQGTGDLASARSWVWALVLGDSETR